MMKLLIEISEDTFNFIKDLRFINTGRGTCKTIQYDVINAIKKAGEAKCKNCIAYRPYGLRKDGYCNVSRMCSEGFVEINVNEDQFCSYFERKGGKR